MSIEAWSLHFKQQLALLRKYYGGLILATVVVGLLLSVLPLPVWVHVGAFSILILTATYLGLRWHLKLLRISRAELNRLVPPKKAE